MLLSECRLIQCEEWGTLKARDQPGLPRVDVGYSFFSLTDKPSLPALSLAPQILVLDPANRILKLGAVLPGQVVKKTVSIMNNSQAPVTFSQSVLFSIPELREPKVGARGSQRPLHAAL